MRGRAVRESLVAYLRALGRHWGAFVVTGGPGALAAFIATAAGLTVPWWVWVALIVVGFFVASWRAYDGVQAEKTDVKTQLAEAQAQFETSAQRKALRDQIARFLSDGEQLYGQVRDDAAPRYGSGMVPTSSTRDWSPELQAWAGQVEAYLRANLGQSYVDLFFSASGLQRGPHHGGFMLSTAHFPVMNTLNHCCQRLEQLLRELPNA